MLVRLVMTMALRSPNLRALMFEMPFEVFGAELAICFLELLVGLDVCLDLA